MKQPKDDPKFIKNKKKIKYIIKFKYKLNSNSNFMALTNPNSTNNTKHQLTTLTLSSYS